MLSFLTRKLFLQFSKNSNVYFMILSIGIIFLYLLSFFTANWDIAVYVHDNLDFFIPMHQLLTDSGMLFSSNNTIIPNVMNGIPRVAFPSEFNVVSLLYYFVEPVTAYMINEALIRFIAFFGMFLLLKQHFFKENVRLENKINYSIITIGTALMFSLLPYWSNAGASIAGQPFVLYAFLNIKNRDLHFKNWFILLAFPFYSSLILAGMFVLAMLTLIAVYDWVKNRTVNFYLFFVLLLISILYLSVEYRLVLNMFDPIFISHRQEFFSENLDFYQSSYKSVKLFFDGQYHADSIHGKYILPFVFISVLIAFIYSVKDRTNSNYTSLMASFLILFSIIAISIFGGFEKFALFQSIKESFPILIQVQFDRFYFLFALLWFLLFAVSAKALLEKTKWGLLLILFALSMQILYSFSIQNSESWRDPKEFKRYYSEKVFSDIKKYISLPTDSYRIMNIGLNPSIAIYNGFYTLDAYLSTYPIEYKHEFRKIIAPQLEKSERWTKYFDNWGSRCRLMDTSTRILLNLEQFKKMGGKYIFSAYTVNINSGKDIEFLHKFFDKESLYDIYLYQVK